MSMMGFILLITIAQTRFIETTIRPEIRISLAVDRGFIIKASSSSKLYRGGREYRDLPPGTYFVKAGGKGYFQSPQQLSHRPMAGFTLWKDIGFSLSSKKSDYVSDVQLPIAGPFISIDYTPTAPPREYPIRRSIEEIPLSSGISVYNSMGFLILRTSKPVRFTSDKGYFTLIEMPGNGGIGQGRTTRSYYGTIEFRMTSDGRLRAINEIDVEEYVKGVLASEMSPDFPLEALKAQAVLARTIAVRKWQRNSLPSNHYDVTDDVFVQLYNGLRNVNYNVSRAVDDTRGEMLFFGQKLAEVHYHASCGGHTENATEVWGHPAYEIGVPDVPEGKAVPDLTTEAGVRKWLDDGNAAFCKVGPNAPRFIQFAAKNFRWKLTYSRHELESLIKRRTHRNFGSLLRLIPIQRGVSGRVTQLRVIGTRSTFDVRGELAIRKLLSPNSLKSTLFYIQTVYGNDGLPEKFIIHGGGFGHGVGMCQTGAAMMALKGYGYRQILKHYYPLLDIYRAY